MKIRKESVAKYPGFFGKSYEPYSEVFGGLVDNLPWWGLEGIYFFGPGKHSMDGLSKESQFIVNPFLLGGLSEFQAFPTMKFTGREDISPPELKDIRWDAQTNSFVVKYDVRNNFRFKFRFNTPGQQEFTLMAYNDRDFGYNYLFMSIENSVNLESLNPIPGRVKKVEEYLKTKENIDLPDAVGQSPIFYAIRGKLSATLELLLAAGNKIDCLDKAHHTPVYFATVSDNPEMLEFFFKHGLTAMSTFEDGLTPLHYAASVPNQEKNMAYLLEKEFPIDAKTNDGSTPLHLAIKAKQGKNVAFLLAHGADANTKNKAQETPLMLSESG